MDSGNEDEISDAEEQAKKIRRLKDKLYRDRIREEDPERHAERLRKHKEWMAKKKAEDPEWADTRNKRTRWSVNARYTNYRADAVARGLSWDLTIEDCESLFIENCHYCGRSPEELVSLMGIDRKDNKRGYHIGNALPCCWLCNRAKKTDTYE